VTYYEDLCACDYFGLANVPLIAVGWLESGQPVPTGDVSPVVFERLFDLVVNPWLPGPSVMFMGWHNCDLCRNGQRGLREVRLGSRSHHVGSGNLFVPTDARLYVAPSLILHYIDTHGYAPPREFQQAVLACPPIGSDEYTRACESFGLISAARASPS
jgi:hypothetical protein